MAAQNKLTGTMMLMYRNSVWIYIHIYNIMWVRIFFIPSLIASIG